MIWEWRLSTNLGRSKWTTEARHATKQRLLLPLPPQLLRSTRQAESSKTPAAAARPAWRTSAHVCLAAGGAQGKVLGVDRHARGPLAHALGVGLCGTRAQALKAAGVGGCRLANQL